MQDLLLTLSGVLSNLTQTLIAAAMALTLAIWLIQMVVRFVASPEAETLCRWSKLALTRITRYLRRQTADPIRHPRLERVADRASVVAAYALSVWTFLCSMLVFTLWQFATKSLSYSEHLLVGFYCVAALYAAKALKAQGGRELVRLRRRRDA